MPTLENRLPAGLSPIEPPRLQSGLIISAQLGSFFFASWVAWKVGVSHQSVAGIVGQACEAAVLAFLASGIITAAFQFANFPPAGFDAVRISLRTARTALWLAPTAILLSYSSPVALIAAVAFVMSATQLAYSQWEGNFESGDSHALLRAWASAIPLGGQTALVAYWMGTPLWAAALACLSVAGLTLLYLVAGVHNVGRLESWPKSLLRVLLTLIFAVVLTVAGRFVVFGSGSQASGEPDPKAVASPLKSARALMKKLSEPDDAEAKEAGAANELITTLYQPSAGIEVTDKSYPGVILWPEVKPTHPDLTAPSPLSWFRPLEAAPRTSFSIPFTGQYWMFKAPHLAPPRGSYFRRESPLALSFLTTDREPMSMKAIQKLDHAIDVSCCRAIDVSISNADRYPGTVALELVLIDTQAPEQTPESLGQRDVLSRPSVKSVDMSAIPVTETLDFAVPRNTRMRRFDGIQVIFHRDRFRIDRSAKISIEHFILVP